MKRLAADGHAGAAGEAHFKEAGVETGRPTSSPRDRRFGALTRRGRRLVPSSGRGAKAQPMN